MKLSFQLLGIAWLILTAGNTSAQSTTKDPKQVAEKKGALCKELENTYQVIVSNPRAKLALTSDLCDIVARERKSDKTVYYKYNDLITLKIYSEAELKTIHKPVQYIIYKEN
jgi:hypothetical protein